MSLPPSFGKVVGPLPQAGRIPEEHRLPCPMRRCSRCARATSSETA